MTAGLWIVVADRDGVAVLDGTGEAIARAMLPALPDLPTERPREASRRERVALSALAVMLRSWLLSEASAGRFDRLALVGPAALRSALELRISDGLASRLVASIEATVAPDDGAAAVAAVSAALLQEAA
jgi:hypothetical protein